MQKQRCFLGRRNRRFFCLLQLFKTFIRPLQLRELLSSIVTERENGGDILSIFTAELVDSIQASFHAIQHLGGIALILTADFGKLTHAYLSLAEKAGILEASS